MSNYDFLDASDGSGDASLMTVIHSRLAAAATIQVDTVAGVSTKFIGTWGKLNAAGLLDPATKRDFRGHVDTGNLIIDAMEPGNVDAGNDIGDVVIIKPTTGWANRVAAFIQNITNLGTPEALTGRSLTSDTDLLLTAASAKNVKITSGAGGHTDIDGSQPKPFFQNALFNFIESGCTWTADAAGSTKAASMSAGVVWIGGKRLTVAAVTGRVFTASKDTYIDFADNGDGTAKVIYTEVTNNAASPSALSDASTFADATNIRNGIVITGASNIAAASSINQGQESRVLPIASSIPYTVTDSIGNLICPRDPNRKLLGYRQVTTNLTTASGSYADITGLNLNINAPADRRLKVTGYVAAGYNSTSTDGGGIALIDVTAGVQLTEAQANSAAVNATFNLRPEQIYTPPASGIRNFKAQFKAVTGGTFNSNATASLPAWVRVELE